MKFLRRSINYKARPESSDFTANKTKPELRRLIKSRLSALSPEDCSSMQAQTYQSTQKLLSNLIETESLSTILLYHAYPKWREVDLSGLERDFLDITFEYAPITPDAPILTTVYDVIFVPLYGFNSDGYRLGHGSGWYDRLLAKRPRAYKIGVGLEVGKIDFTPEPHDIQIDFIITEQRVLKTTAPSL